MWFLISSALTLSFITSLIQLTYQSRYNSSPDLARLRSWRRLFSLRHTTLGILRPATMPIGAQLLMWWDVRKVARVGLLTKLLLHLSLARDVRAVSYYVQGRGNQAFLVGIWLADRAVLPSGLLSGGRRHLEISKAMVMAGDLWCEGGTTGFDRSRRTLSFSSVNGTVPRASPATTYHGGRGYPPSSDPSRLAFPD